MLIAQRMISPVRTVRPLDSIRHAREIMETYRINQLPVVHGGDLIGIITDRDLRDAFPSVFASASDAAAHRHRHDGDPGTIPVEIVMTSDVLTLAPHDTLATAARLMRRERVGAVPIVDHGRLVGIVTRSDVLDAYLDGAERDGRIAAAVTSTTRPNAGPKFAS
jgi:acetoin utilization protein AcuB